MMNRSVGDVCELLLGGGAVGTLEVTVFAKLPGEFAARPSKRLNILLVDADGPAPQ